MPLLRRESLHRAQAPRKDRSEMLLLVVVVELLKGGKAGGGKGRMAGTLQVHVQVVSLGRCLLCNTVTCLFVGRVVEIFWKRGAVVLQPVRPPEVKKHSVREKGSNMLTKYE